MNAIVLDTETADLNGNLIELAWLNPKTGADFNQRYNPGCKIEPGAMAVHHIIDADVADKPHYLTISTSGAIPDDVEYIIGHNIDYDMAVLSRSGIDITRFKSICTLALARKAWPELKSHTIGALMYFLSESQEIARDMLKGAHSALADVHMTALILRAIMKKLALSDNPKFLHIASENALIPTHMPFGKHKGVALVDLDQGYVSWALRNMTELDPRLRNALIASQRSIA